MLLADKIRGYSLEETVIWTIFDRKHGTFNAKPLMGLELKDVANIMEDPNTDFIVRGPGLFFVMNNGLEHRWFKMETVMSKKRLEGFISELNEKNMAPEDKIGYLTQHARDIGTVMDDIENNGNPSHVGWSETDNGAWSAHFGTVDAFLVPAGHERYEVRMGMRTHSPSSTITKIIESEEPIEKIMERASEITSKEVARFMKPLADTATILSSYKPRETFEDDIEILWSNDEEHTESKRLSVLHESSCRSTTMDADARTGIEQKAALAYLTKQMSRDANDYSIMEIAYLWPKYDRNIPYAHCSAFPGHKLSDLAKEAESLAYVHGMDVKFMLDHRHEKVIIETEDNRTHGRTEYRMLTSDDAEDPIRIHCMMNDPFYTDKSLEKFVTQKSRSAYGPIMAILDKDGGKR